MSRTIGVVLAGGRGARLSPHIPPFMKPLLTANGRTIVGQAVEKIAPLVDIVVVVVAPTNAEQVVHVTHHLSDKIHYVIQPDATSPGDALDRALELAQRDDRVLLVMGDNVLGPDDVETVVAKSLSSVGAVIGTAVLPFGPSERFTRLDGSARWTEGVYTPDEKALAESASHQRVWLGPIAFVAKDWFENRDRCYVGDEMKISPFFSMIPTVIVDCFTTDVGEVGAF